jgi:hypothetical protein
LFVARGFIRPTSFSREAIDSVLLFHCGHWPHI